MRTKVLQILWHSKDPVFSLDFHPNGLLVTAGQDKEIMLWDVGREADGSPAAQPRATLMGGHTRGVNTVRFSPTGEHLVSAGDGGEMLLWKVDMGQLAGDDTHWGRTVLRAHTDDVQDVAWAPDGTALVSGGIENTSVVWDAASARGVLRLEGHRHYVQGASWDPANKFIATLSCDRTCRVHGLKPPVAGKKKRSTETGPPTAAAIAKDFVCHHVLSKGPATVVPYAGGEGAEGGKAHRPPLFEDEGGCNSFFRRLTWSPDGSFLAVPTGLLVSSKPGSSGSSATHLYARGHWDAPLLSLPAPSSPTLAVAFCPRLFALRPALPGDSAACATNSAGQKSGHETAIATSAADAVPSHAAAASGATVDQRDKSAAAPAGAPAECGDAPPETAAAASEAEAGDNSPGAAVQLPYRMVFAVATRSSIILYDTQGMQAVAVLAALHPAPITDLAWSCDGATLAASSKDGYCSMTAFSPNELGAPPPEGAVPPHIQRRLLAAAKAVAPRPPAPPRQSTEVKQQAQQQQQQQQQHSPAPAPAAMTVPCEASVPEAPQAAQQAVQQAGASGVEKASGKAAPRRIQPSPVPATTPTCAALPMSAATLVAAASGPAAPCRTQPSPVPAVTPAGDGRTTTAAAVVVPASAPLSPAVMPKGAPLPKRRIEPVAVSVGAERSTGSAAAPQTSAPAAQPAAPVTHASGAAKPAAAQKRRIAPQPAPPPQPAAAAAAPCTPAPSATAALSLPPVPHSTPALSSYRPAQVSASEAAASIPRVPVHKPPSNVTAAAVAQGGAGGSSGKRSGDGVSGITAGTGPKKQRRLTPMPVA